MGRLNYLKLNQNNLRADLYKGVVDALNKDDNASAKDIGKTTILPSSFTGGVRFMMQLFQDAMSCIRLYGKPDLFITFTTNPMWPEILRELKKFEKSNDRPDLITRVFNLKLKALCEDLLKNNILGVAVAHLSIVTEQHVQVVQVYAKLVLVQQNVFHVFLTINLMVQHVAVFQINMKTIKLVLIVLLIA